MFVSGHFFFFTDYAKIYQVKCQPVAFPVKTEMKPYFVQSSSVCLYEVNHDAFSLSTALLFVILFLFFTLPSLRISCVTFLLKEVPFVTLYGTVLLLTAVSTCTLDGIHMYLEFDS